MSFEATQLQVGFNGFVSDLVKNPNSDPNFNGTFDAYYISQAPLNSDLYLSFGVYGFDKNPFIGHIININAWDRTMKNDGKYLTFKANQKFYAAQLFPYVH